MSMVLINGMEEILDFAPGSLNLDTDFKALGEWDSLAALSLMVLIEDIYKKIIDPAVLKRSRTIAELVENIAKVG